MTFCLGINLASGLLGIADTRVVTGAERISARKLWISQDPQRPFFLMSAGLRSLRDKVVVYFEDALETESQSLDRVFKVVNLYAAQLRRVADEDRTALEASGFRFDAHTLIGGQLRNDDRHHLFLVYPEGNWVEIGQGTPYQIIGEGSYGKPVLDRTLNYDDAMSFAFKVGYLAFDSTRMSAADVDFPIDVVIYLPDSHRMVEQRYHREELEQVSSWWHDRMRQSVDALPVELIEEPFARLAVPLDRSFDRRAA